MARMEPVIGIVVTTADESAPAALVAEAAPSSTNSWVDATPLASAVPIDVPVISPLLPQHFVSSSSFETWRSEGDAEERKIRFIASQPFWTRMRIWTRTRWHQLCDGPICSWATVIGNLLCSCCSWIYCPLLVIGFVVYAVMLLISYDVSRLACEPSAAGQFDLRAWSAYGQSYLAGYNVTDAATGTALLSFSFTSPWRLEVNGSSAARDLGFPAHVVFVHDMTDDAHMRHDGRRCWEWSSMLDGKPLNVRALDMLRPARRPLTKSPYFLPALETGSAWPAWMQRVMAKVDAVNPRAYHTHLGTPTDPRATKIESIHFGFAGRVFLQSRVAAEATSRLALNGGGPPTAPGWTVVAQALGSIFTTPQRYSLCTAERLMHGDATETLLLLTTLVLAARVGDNHDERLDFNSPHRSGPEYWNDQYDQYDQWNDPF